MDETLSLVSKECTISLAKGKADTHFFSFEKEGFITTVWLMPFKRDSLILLQNVGHGEATGRGNDKLTAVFCDSLPFLMITVILVLQVF